MFITAITPTETYIADASTLTLYDSNGNILAHGFLRIVATMLRKNIVAVKKYDRNGNRTIYMQSKRVFA